MSERESLIERLRKLVETGKSYAKSELNGAPTSTFEIYMGHFAAITDEIAAALSSMEAGAEPVAWRYKFPNETEWQYVADDPTKRLMGSPVGRLATIEPLYPSPASVPAGAIERLRSGLEEIEKEGGAYSRSIAAELLKTVAALAQPASGEGEAEKDYLGWLAGHEPPETGFQKAPLSTSPREAEGEAPAGRRALKERKP